MRQESLKDSIWIWAGALLLVLGALAAATYLYRGEPEAPSLARDAPLEPAPTTAEAGSLPAAVRPSAAAPAVPEPEPPPEPLPELDESDDEVLGFLTVFIGRDAVKQFIVPSRIVRNAVVTIDNLARDKVNPQQRPIRAAPGEFLVEGTDEAPLLAEANYARYTPLVEAVAAADTKTLVTLYRRLYPLFRQAYDALGHRDGNFNTRFLEVIEHLLATPEVRGPIRLERPAVLYKYADPALEALSPGQKLLLRMGPDNARIIKAKLREIRDELV